MCTYMRYYWIVLCSRAGNSIFATFVYFLSFTVSERHDFGMGERQRQRGGTRTKKNNIWWRQQLIMDLNVTGRMRSIEFRWTCPKNIIQTLSLSLSLCISWRIKLLLCLGRHFSNCIRVQTFKFCSWRPNMCTFFHSLLESKLIFSFQEANAYLFKRKEPISSNLSEFGLPKANEKK